MFEQVKLPYSYDSLEPYIDALTVEIHYSKHHAAYTKNFNDAVEKAGMTGKNVIEVLSSIDSADPSLQNTLRNNGGGYYNHNLYFSTLSPNPKKVPEGELAEKINSTFGSLEELIEKLSKSASGQFGSGWAWLSVKKDGSLEVTSTGNQDNPISLKSGSIPILALDVWEHAYYLKYKNLRGDYIKAFFSVLDWSAVERNYNNAMRNF